MSDRKDLQYKLEVSRIAFRMAIIIAIAAAFNLAFSVRFAVYLAIHERWGLVAIFTVIAAFSYGGFEMFLAVARRGRSEIDEIRRRLT